MEIRYTSTVFPLLLNIGHIQVNHIFYSYSKTVATINYNF